MKRFVFISTIKVNGEGRDAPYCETDAPAPEDAYAISKWEAEQGLQRIAADTGLEVVILRPPLVYGPGVKANFLRLMQRVQRGWTFLGSDGQDLSTFELLRRLGLTMGQSARLFYVVKLA